MCSVEHEQSVAPPQWLMLSVMVTIGVRRNVGLRRTKSNKNPPKRDLGGAVRNCRGLLAAPSCSKVIAQTVNVGEHISVAPCSAVEIRGIALANERFECPFKGIDLIEHPGDRLAKTVYFCSSRWHYE